MKILPRQIYELGRRGFTLFELMISMTIFALLMSAVILSVENMSIARITTENRITLLGELYFFSENLISEVKNGGVLDYEEYWNRSSYDTTIGGSGHYIKPDGLGNYGSGGDLTNNTNNFGDGLYYCRSSGATLYMGTGGCLTTNNNLGSTKSTTTDQNYSGTYQRYGQYALQYYDYNGNRLPDGGDEDGDGSIIGDEDDKEIGDAPKVLSGAIPELYLINTDLKTRTYFRWNIKADPNAPSGISCTFARSSTGIVNVGSGCVGNIQILKLRGLDLGLNHTDTTANNTGAFDGIIDTWVCHPDWKCEGGTVPGYTSKLATGNDSEWVDLFPDFVNVKNVSFTAYPEKDPWKSWAAQDCIGASCDPNFISPFIHPYVRIQLSLGFAWGKRRVIRNDDPTISINTSVNLGN